MSILSKLMDTMRFSPEEEDDDYFGPDEEYEEEKPAKRSRYQAREEAENYDDVVEKPRLFSRSSKVVPMKRGMEVSMVKPTSIEDAREICEIGRASCRERV